MAQNEDLDLCRICGDPATGVYYRVRACTACRSFYRRCLKKNVVNYICRFGRRCAPHLKSSLGSAWCRACRYQTYRALSESEDTLRNGFWLTINTLAELERDDMNKKHANSPGSVIRHSPPKTKLSPHEVDDVTSACRKKKISAVADSQIITVPHKIPVAYSSTNSVIRHTKLFAFDPNNNDDVFRRKSEQFDFTDDSFQRHPGTFQAVNYALNRYFGDQIAIWTEFRDQALLHGLVPIQPETDVDTVAAAINSHNTDNFRRTQEFAGSLPGIRDFSLSCRRLMMTDWKCFITALIHVSPFMIDNETYFTLGSQHYRYCRYWQEHKAVTNWGYQVIVYKFCNTIRDLGLTDVERYILIVVILLEPGTRAHEDYETLCRVHRHYLNVLTSSISRRCSDAAEWSVICRKLGIFFDILKNIFDILREHFAPPNFSPPCCRALRLQLVHINPPELPKILPSKI